MVSSLGITYIGYMPLKTNSSYTSTMYPTILLIFIIPLTSCWPYNSIIQPPQQRLSYSTTFIVSPNPIHIQHIPSIHYVLLACILMEEALLQENSNNHDYRISKTVIDNVTIKRIQKLQYLIITKKDVNYLLWMKSCWLNKHCKTKPMVLYQPVHSYKWYSLLF